jgi:uncharacterized protein YegL
MTSETHMTDEVNADRTDLKRTFSEIREALEKAQSREDLTELYKQSVYMILMTHSTPLDEKDKEMRIRRETTEKEFTSTVRMINQQAKKIGVEADYNEDWERLATNSYKTEEVEGGNTLEAKNETGITRE